jgi:hypothetical protein
MWLRCDAAATARVATMKMAVLGFVMRLRGTIPVHASAVMIGGKAVAFADDAWSGKSTTAAAFASLGHPVLSDDLLPIVDVNGAILPYPSHPRITMWPDSARGLFGGGEELPQLTPTYDKRYVDLQHGDRFQPAPVPLEVIYVLSARATDGEAMRIETIPPYNALMSLVGNTYGNYLLDGAMRALEFDLSSRVVNACSGATTHPDRSERNACATRVDDSLDLRRRSRQTKQYEQRGQQAAEAALFDAKTRHIRRHYPPDAKQYASPEKGR